MRIAFAVSLSSIVPNLSRPFTKSYNQKHLMEWENTHFEILNVKRRDGEGGYSKKKDTWLLLIIAVGTFC